MYQLKGNILHVLYYRCPWFQYVCGKLWRVHKAVNWALGKNKNQSLGYVSIAIIYCSQKSFCLKPQVIVRWISVSYTAYFSAMRELASQALHRLTQKDPEFVRTQILPDVLDGCTSIDLNERHGAILAAAEITHQLSKLGSKENK